MHSFVSSHSIIAKLYRDLRIESDAFEDFVIEWIGESLDFLSVPVTYVEKDEILQIKSYNIELPRDFKQLTDVYYSVNATKETEKSMYNVRMIFKGKNRKLTQHFTGVNSINANAPTYSINFPFIQTDVESGYALVFYKGVPIDELKYPLIPDHSSVKEAIKWKIVLHLMEGGWKHPAGLSYGDVMQLWEKYASQARSIIKMPTNKDYELLSESWSTFIEGAEVFYSDNVVEPNSLL